MSTTVFNVANHILQNDNKKFDLLQLIKLCYLSYGWYLSLANKKLFEEEIQAWKYGPVIPELYYALKHFSGRKLPSNCLQYMAINNDPELKLSDDMKKLIDAVVDHYGDCTGVQLSALTHKKGSPWEKTYAGIGRRWVQIPDDVIKRHFDRLGN